MKRGAFFGTMTASAPWRPMTRSLAGKTLFITGASRGIGLAIAMRAARDGANIVVAAKSVTENPRIPGTIYTAAAEIEAAGGQALAVPCDIRFEDQVDAAVSQAVSCFGGIDILVNNASAIDLRGIDALEMKRFDLMHQINARGTYLCCKAALPHLRKSANPHILTLSPPLDLNPKWFSPNLAYTMSKYGMSLVTLGLARTSRPTASPSIRCGRRQRSRLPLSAIFSAATNCCAGRVSPRSSPTPRTPF